MNRSPISPELRTKNNRPLAAWLGGLLKRLGYEQQSYHYDPISDRARRIGEYLADQRRNAPAVAGLHLVAPKPLLPRLSDDQIMQEYRLENFPPDLISRRPRPDVVLAISTCSPGKRTKDTTFSGRFEAFLLSSGGYLIQCDPYRWFQPTSQSEHNEMRATLRELFGSNLAQELEGQHQINLGIINPEVGTMTPLRQFNPTPYGCDIEAILRYGISAAQEGPFNVSLSGHDVTEIEQANT